MSEHLPECPRIEYIVNRHGYTLTAGSNVCMCNALRACEQRVEETWSAIAGLDQYAEGYVAGLDAAREAVAAVPPIDQRVDDNGLISLVYDKGEILAAIDALKTK